MTYMTTEKAMGILENTNPVMGMAATYYRVAVDIGGTYLNKEVVRQATVELLAPVTHLFSEEMDLGTDEDYGMQMRDALSRLYGSKAMIEIGDGRTMVDWKVDADKVLFHSGRGGKWFGAWGLFQFTKALDLVLEDLNPSEPEIEAVVEPQQKVVETTTKPDPKPTMVTETETESADALSEINRLIGEMMEKYRQRRS